MCRTKYFELPNEGWRRSPSGSTAKQRKTQVIWHDIETEKEDKSRAIDTPEMVRSFMNPVLPTMFYMPLFARCFNDE